MLRLLLPFLLVGPVLAASPYEEKHMEDACFHRIKPVFSNGGKVGGVQTNGLVIRNRDHYVVTFKIAGPLPTWYRERTISCYFDKSTKRLVADDLMGTRLKNQKIDEQKQRDAQERFKVNRYNSMRQSELK